MAFTRERMGVGRHIAKRIELARLSLTLTEKIFTWKKGPGHQLLTLRAPLPTGLRVSTDPNPGRICLADQFYIHRGLVSHKPHILAKSLHCIFTDAIHLVQISNVSSWSQTAVVGPAARLVMWIAQTRCMWECHFMQYSEYTQVSSWTYVQNIYDTVYDRLALQYKAIQ